MRFLAAVAGGAQDTPQLMRVLQFLNQLLQDTQARAVKQVAIYQLDAFLRIECEHHLAGGFSADALALRELLTTMATTLAALHRDARSDSMTRAYALQLRAHMPGTPPGKAVNLLSRCAQLLEQMDLTQATEPFACIVIRTEAAQDVKWAHAQISALRTSLQGRVASVLQSVAAAAAQCASSSAVQSDPPDLACECYDAFGKLLRAMPGEECMHCGRRSSAQHILHNCKRCDAASYCDRCDFGQCCDCTVHERAPAQSCLSMRFERSVISVHRALHRSDVAARALSTSLVVRDMIVQVNIMQHC